MVLRRGTLREIREAPGEASILAGATTPSLVEIAKAPPASKTEESDSVDPEMLLLAAQRARFASRSTGRRTRPTLLKNLDGVIRAYDEALRAGIERPDVAFNYELAVQDARRGGQRQAEGHAAPVARDGRQEPTPNMHGDPGEPPKDMKVEQFQIRIPMDPKDSRRARSRRAGTARRGGSAG